MSRPRVCLLGILFLAVGTCRAFAGDVYAVRFEVHSQLADGFLCVNWYDDLVFHNPTTTDATVSLLGVSNGPCLQSRLCSKCQRVRPWRESHCQLEPGLTCRIRPLWVVHLDVAGWE